jgi:6-phosphogluconolactonase
MLTAMIFDPCNLPDRIKASEEHAMLSAKPIGFQENRGRLEADERCEPIAGGSPPRVRVILGSIFCSLACACGGGGGYSGGSGNPPPPPPSATLLYVTNGAVGTIDVLTIDPKTGIPTPISGSPLADGPMPSAIAVDPQKRFLYVASSSGQVRGYLLNSSTGTLTAMNGSPFSTTAPPVAIAVDPTGQFVVTANGSTNTVSVFKIGSTGALAEVAGSPYKAGANPIAIVVAAGRYVYAANKAGGSVSAYLLDMTSGSLTPLAGSPVPIGASPQGLVVDPAGTHLYAADMQPSGVSGLTINVSSGALTTIPGSPFLTSSGASSPVMDAAAKRLHVANGTDVDCYTVDASSGALAEIGLSRTNGGAAALAVDGPGNFLYALDNVKNQIEVFSIDAASGSLTLIAGSPFPLFPGSSQQALGPNSITVVY